MAHRHVSHPIFTDSESAVAAGDEKDSDDDEPDNVAIIEKVAKAVIHNEFLQKFLRAFCLSVSIICQGRKNVTVFCRTSLKKITECVTICKKIILEV